MQGDRKSRTMPKCRFCHLDVSNPFCAARLRPGTIDFVFEPGKSIEQLIAKLEANAWRGQIIGQHGTGKSTLLAALTLAMEDRGPARKGNYARGGAAARCRRDFLGSLRADLRAEALAAVDGVGQLPIWNRIRLKWYCRTHGVGLVVTSHRSAHLPDLYETAIDPARAWNVVQRLQAGFPQRIEYADLVERLARHAGNLREALFDLFDLYEARAAG